MVSSEVVVQLCGESDESVEVLQLSLKHHCVLQSAIQTPTKSFHEQRLIPSGRHGQCPERHNLPLNAPLLIRQKAIDGDGRIIGTVEHSLVVCLQLIKGWRGKLWT